LANDAVKFTETGEVRIECKFDDKNLEVTVSEAGIGIKKENMDLLLVDSGKSIPRHREGIEVLDWASISFKNR